ncbi:MAG: hypothetical protein Q8P20_10060 [bacterium]|nr:hypothetical protein [bacterium]
MNEQNIPQPNEPVQSSKHIWITTIAVVITAIIVGGGIYVWQKSRLQSTEKSFQQQIGELQSQIVNLQQVIPPADTTPEVTQEPTQPTDATADWRVYKNSNLRIQFQYPKDWNIREQITEYNNRIYIENQEYKNYNVGNYPKDFLSMWIDYRKPTIETLSYENQVKQFDNMVANKKLIKNWSLTIYTYEFGYNPNSERSGVGPYLEAVWKDNSWIYNATTMDSNNKENNAIKVDILKQILSTFEFTK